MNPPDKPSTRQAIAWIMDNMSIVDFLKYRGYEIDKQRNCSRYTALTMGGAEKLVVPRCKNQGVPSRYFDQYEKKGKSIIDFVMERDNLDLHGAVELLLQHAQRTDFIPYTTSANEKEREKKINAMKRRHRRYIKKYCQGRPDLTDPTYLLEERMISAETLQHRTFKDRLWNAYYDKADRICFPFYSESNQVVGLSFKSKGYNKVIGSKSDGIWVSKHTRSASLPIDKLFIVEHPLNAMAHFELRHRPEENNLYVSAMGSAAWKQLDLVQKIIDSRTPQQVVLSHDRDQQKVIVGKDGQTERIIPAAGQVYDTKLTEYLKHAHPFVILKPELGSDFNDELIAYKQSCFGCHITPAPLEASNEHSIVYRLAKLATNYYQAHAYQPTTEDEQLYHAQREGHAAYASPQQHRTALKSWAVLRHYPYQVLAYMRTQLREAEFSVFVQLVEIS